MSSILPCFWLGGIRQITYFLKLFRILSLSVTVSAGCASDPLNRYHYHRQDFVFAPVGLYLQEYPFFEVYL